MKEEIPEKIPDDVKIRVPLFRSEWMSMIRKLRKHPHAPRWNTFCGDRLEASDLAFVRAFGDELAAERKAQTPFPGERIIGWIRDLTRRSWWFADYAGKLNLPADFHLIPFMERSDLQVKLEQIVPHDATLSGLIINPTSGTTGQPILCPGHPRATGCYDPLIQFALARHGVKEIYDHHRVAAIQLCCQQQTITYNTVHAALDGAGFAKINLAESEWKSAESAAFYTADMAPVFLSGDPYAFFMGIQLAITCRPRALLSTALGLTPVLRRTLEQYYQCPVVNFYSLNETGPIAYSCPVDPESFHILPHDIYVETTGADNMPCRTGGEITVTGGRNPYLPLLRYRTGDNGVLDYAPCSCGDPMPRIKSLEARKTVFLYTKTGKVVNPVDISRVIKDFPVIMHQFIQEKDYRCRLRLLMHIPLTAAMGRSLVNRLETLFDNSLEVQLVFDLSPLEGKIIPYICRLEEQWINHEYFQY